ELKIEVLATKSPVPGGKLDQATPTEDAVWSKPITVKWVQALAGQVIINFPLNGTAVDFSDKIVGDTSYPDLNHYIVVTPVKTGTAFVQDLKATLNRDNRTFTGTARFGGVDVGVGEQFMLRIIATRTTLTPGPLIGEPPDSINSNTITVSRRK